MNAISSKTFKSGNSVALRLPKEIGFGPGMDVVIERNGDVLTIRPAINPAEEKRKLRKLLADLRALGVPEAIERREPIEFPDRPGL